MPEIPVELAVQAGTSYDAVQLVGESVYWIEGRPDGSDALVVWDAHRGVRDALPAGVSVASSVHGYGGGAYLAAGEDVWFCDADDQRIYHHDQGGAITPLTPEPSTPGALRYADLRLNHDGTLLLAVLERHDANGVTNELVSIPAQAPGAVELVAAGWDFYSCPRPSPDGRHIAWICWNIPHMPWDATWLYIAELDNDGKAGTPVHIAGGPEESVLQPEWSPDGILHFISDRSGWWNLYARHNDSTVTVLEEEAELGAAPWEFGYSTYTFLDGDRIAVLAQNGGRQHLQILHDGKPHDVPLPYTSIKPYLTGHSATVAAIASQPAGTPAVILIDDVGTGHHRRLAGSDTDAYPIALAEPFSFPTRDGQQAYGLYYRPQSTATGEAPPLIVKAHPGPTSNFPQRLDWHTQILTSRGYGVAEIDYRGSTGYGRPYRNALRGHWGHRDAHDCADAATHLTHQGKANPGGMIIWGASAGGYTALRALALTDVFTAAIAVSPVIDPTTWQAAAPKFQADHPETLTGPTPTSPLPTRQDLQLQAGGQLKRVLIIHSDDDPITPAGASRDFAQALGPAATLITLTNGGHTLRTADSARQALNAQLTFLKATVMR